MVQCKNCQKEVAYKNRFHNYCPECKYKRKGKIHNKGDPYKLKHFKWKNVCGCQIKNPKYWVDDKKEGEDEQEEINN